MSGRDREFDTVQRELKLALSLLNAVAEITPGLIYAKDKSGRFLFANAAALDLIGKPWCGVAGKLDTEILNNPAQAANLMTNDRRIMDGRVQEELEEVVDHPVNGLRAYRSTKVPLVDAYGDVTGVVGFSVDITGRNEVDTEFLHVARRTAMGDMAAAIAHEINQPLAAISMFLAGSIAMLERDRYDGPLIQSLAAAKDQCLRAGDIIRRVRSFVSGGDDVKLPETLSAIVDEACALALLGSRESGINTIIEHAHPDVPVLVDKVQIEQVIVNLVRNALDAMGAAKMMTLRVTSGYSDTGTPMVSVSDSGPGVSPEVANRLFEPFVSTKGVRGMGVGLSVCRTIIESHGGRICVEAYTGSGATFHFTLPRLADEKAAS